MVIRCFDTLDQCFPKSCPRTNYGPRERYKWSASHFFQRLKYDPNGIFYAKIAVRKTVIKTVTPFMDDPYHSLIFFLASTSDNGQLIKLQIINGTNWLNLGGDVHSFKLVLGRPPSTASDVTLQEALSQLNEVLT